VQDLNLRPTD